MTLLDADRVRTARTAVAVVFAASGFAFASVIARIPAVREVLDLSPGRLGLVLLAVSGGSVLALPSSGPVVHRLGAARAVLLGASLMCAGLTLAALSPEVLASIPALVAGLFLVGVGNGLWDVAMNVEGADVERRLGRAIMPRFHAAFSLGTVAGAAGGALAAGFGLSIAEHVLPTTAVVLVAVVVAVRSFVPVEEPEQVDPTASPKGSGVREAWREPRTLLIGLLVLGMAFAEGSANDWLAVGLVDGYGAGQALAAAGYGAFVTAMTIGRLAGPAVLDRYGRVPVLRGGALLVLLGVLVYVGGSGLPDGSTQALAVATVGALLWGIGASLGFPVGMSAAADDPAKAAARVSVVASVGYLAFLAGPPLLGLLGEHVGVVRAMLGVAGAVALSLAAAGAARPLPVPAEESRPA